MKSIRFLFSFTLVIASFTAFSQSDYVPLGSKEYTIIDRLQIKLRTDSILNFSDIRPYSRKVVTERLEYINKLASEGKISLSAVDKYNIELSLK